MSDKPEGVDAPEDVERNITASDPALARRATKDDKRPIYQVRGDSRIPVSKHAGKVWEGRVKAASAKRENTGVVTAWDEALKYFNNDQLGHREDKSPDRPGNQARASRKNGTFTETENVVFANVAAQVPLLYAKNPSVEVTSTKKNDQVSAQQATMAERLVNVLFQRKSAPGINLKPKARRAVVMASLTNRAYIEVGYTRKTESSEEALNTLRQLSEQLAKAKSGKEIQEIEGKIEALEQSIDVLRPAGPWAKFRRPHQVMVDPTCMEDDLSDANWVAVYDYVAASFIMAQYADKTEKEYKSIYKPTHVLKVNVNSANGESAEHEDQSFTLFSDTTEHSAHGYATKEAYKSAQYIKVWYVWDKITRRVLLFNDGDWSWPIWVWDDPYNLDTFFPLVPLSFYTNPEGGEAKGEVTYYLDQQDAINEIIDEERRARLWAKRNIFFDKNKISQADAMAVLRGTDDAVVGVDVPEGQSINDCVWSMVPPSVKFAELFNVERKLQAIDRISSTTDMMRGVQFKTNTTNKAIESYQSTTQTRIDEKIDAIEDMIGQVGWMVLQLVLQFMEPPTVAQLIGEENAQGWQTIPAAQIPGAYSCTVVGGSAQKPTSAQKKKEAMELGQVLGQFADISPVVVEVMLMVMEPAFDEIVMTEEMWRGLREAIFQKKQSNAAGGDGGSAGGGAEGGDPTQQIMQVLQMLQQQLPPEAQRAIGVAIQRGVPLGEAVMRVMQQAAQATQAAGTA